MWLCGENCMKNVILILGDAVTIALLTFVGFAAHGEAGVSFLPRFAAIYFPLSAAWFLLASALGLFHQEIIANPKQLWRPALAALFAAPLAAVLRGFLLNAPVIPVFALVLGGTTALGIVLWRGLYFRFNHGSRT